MPPRRAHRCGHPPNCAQRPRCRLHRRACRRATLDTPRACPPCSPLCCLPPPWHAQRGGCPPKCAQRHAQLLLRSCPQARRCAPQRCRARLQLRPHHRSCPSPLLNVCCIAAHVPHSTRHRAHPRPGYVVGIPVLIVHVSRTNINRCVDSLQFSARCNSGANAAAG
ncbi:hypothetical protein B0H14DRAFT_3600993, partial [Mycena olivaceomarginata]